MVSPCAHLSHPPTHWHAETCHQPGRESSETARCTSTGPTWVSFRRHLFLSKQGSLVASIARVERGPSDSLYLPLRRSGQVALYCAHEPTTALSWGLCEQEGHLAAPPHTLL